MNPHLRSFHGAGVWAWLSWLLCFRDCQEAAIQELARAGILSESLTLFPRSCGYGKIGLLQADELRPLVPSWLLTALSSVPSGLLQLFTSSKHTSQEGNRGSPRVRCKLQSHLT